MKNYHLITVKYFGPSDARGSRVKLTSTRFNESKTINYDYIYNTAIEQAVDWLKNNGHNPVGLVQDGIICEAVNGTFRGLN